MTEDGIVVIDVWESEEAMETFFQEQLGAAIHESGMPEAQPRVARVHNTVPKGAGTAPNVIMLIELDAGPEVYDQMVEQMGAHVGGGENHPSYSHVAAVTESGGMLIFDLWESPEAFGQFAAQQVGQAAAESLGEIEPRFVPVHNHMRGRATANA